MRGLPSAPEEIGGRSLRVAPGAAHAVGFAGLDELILFLKRGFGMTVLVVTHALDSAFRIADRVAMLYQGSLIAVDTPAEFKASTHPRVRQFVQGEPERLSGASDGFAASFLKEFHA